MYVLQYQINKYIPNQSSGVAKICIIPILLIVYSLIQSYNLLYLNWRKCLLLVPLIERLFQCYYIIYVGKLFETNRKNNGIDYMGWSEAVVFLYFNCCNTQCPEIIMLIYYKCVIFLVVIKTFLNNYNLVGRSTN